MKKTFVFAVSFASLGVAFMSCAGNIQSDADFIDVSSLPNSKEFDAEINAQIDQHLTSYNAKEEIRKPVMANKATIDDYNNIILNNLKYTSLTLTYRNYVDSKDVTFTVDRYNQKLERTVKGAQKEVFELGGDIKEVPPLDVYIPYAFASDFTRIAHSITLRTHAAYVPGSAKKESFDEPDEVRINETWCRCYDVKLKSRCAPLESLTMFVDNEQNVPIQIHFNYIQPTRETENGEKEIIEEERIPSKIFNVSWREYQIKQDNGSEKVLVLPQRISCTDLKISYVLTGEPVCKD